MSNQLLRMWINQPSSLQPLHALHGVNVLAHLENEHDKTMRIYFLSGNVTSQDAPRDALSKGWMDPAVSNTVETQQSAVVEVVMGLHKALSRMVDKHDPDSIESEWLSHSNELVRKLTGEDVPARKFNYMKP